LEREESGSLRVGKVDLSEARILGKTGLRVGPLGVASSFGAPAAAFEEAFERGCNYFYWGSMRKPGMREAIRNLCSQGKRDRLILALQSYSRSAALMEVFFKRGLAAAGVDHADVLLLGLHNKKPSPRVMERALELRQKGLCRFVGVSGHKRELFPRLARDNVFDLFHIRYNAAHRGAEKEIFPNLPADDRPGVVAFTATRWAQLINPKKTPPGETPPSASDCYRFVLSNPAVDVCICGPKDMSQMREALRTLDLGTLSPEEMGRMRRIGDYVHDHTSRFF